MQLHVNIYSKSRLVTDIIKYRKWSENELFTKIIVKSDNEIK